MRSAMKWRSLQESSSALDLRPLRDQYAERKEAIARYVPADVQAIHGRTIAHLREQGLATKALGVGAHAPSFEMLDHDGKLISSADMLTRGRIVALFIRGRWCPFDVGQIEAMNVIVPQIEESGASLIAVSPQTQKQAFFMHDQHKMKFPLLVDEGNALARQFGLVYRVPEEQQALYQRTFINLPFINGDANWELPIPATYIIGRDGAILFAMASEDYTDRPEPLEILRALEAG